MALEKDGLAFTAFFQHRLAEIRDNIEDIRTIVHEMEPVRKIDGSINPADVCLFVFCGANSSCQWTYFSEMYRITYAVSYSLVQSSWSLAQLIG